MVLTGSRINKKDMKRTRNYAVYSFSILLLLLFGISCQSDSDSGKGKIKQKDKSVEISQLNVPDFSEDSAFVYIEKQLDFGPRVPNSSGHVACASWLVEKLNRFGAEVSTQAAVVQAYDGTPLNMQNIIARINPDRAKRIMLSAHWDTRPVADQDKDLSKRGDPIPGANDGGSGVAVLLELVRQIVKDSSLNLGVDIFLWDAEDYGNSNVEDSYCLGSQYWAKNKKPVNYQALYGINLDMVGGINARFTQEGQSLTYAPNVVKKVWNTASKLGYGKYFSPLKTDGILDDHYYINRLANIPMIDIIDRQPGISFFGQWHTHQDDIHIISKESLKAVGHTVLTILYMEDAV